MFLGSQLHHSNLCLRLHMVSSLCVSIRTSVLQMSSSYKDISHWIRTHTNSIWLHLNLIISGKNTFPNKVIYSKGTWVKTSTCLFVVFFFFLRKTMFYWIVSLWFFLNFYLFIWLCHVLVAAGRIILESSGIFWWSTRIPQVWCTGSAVAAHGWA